jgi:hypothetical protein
MSPEALALLAFIAMVQLLLDRRRNRRVARELAELKALVLGGSAAEQPYAFDHGRDAWVDRVSAELER